MSAVLISANLEMAALNARISARIGKSEKG